jgi:hypothetical protein
MKTLTKFASAVVALVVLALAPMGVTWAQVKVTAAAPASTYQGTVGLDVVVSGSGFDSTAEVQFLVSGTINPGGVTVKKVLFNNPSELVATIDVDAMANITNFDIIVKLDSGRKGKGTTLFAVRAKTADPCAASGLTFPAFAYQRQNSNNSWTIYVADATGKCSRSIANWPARPQSMSFSFPISGAVERGRVVWRGSGTSIVGVDFTVAGNAIVLDPLRTIYSPVGCCLADLSRDGRTLYFSLTDNVLATLDLSSDGASPVPFYTFVTTPYGAHRGSVNGDQTLLFIDEFEADSTTKLVRLTLPPAPTVRTILPTYANGPFWPAANLDDGRIAFLEYVTGTNYCGQLVVTDSDGTSRQIFTNRFGKFATWLGSDVLMERESVDRRGNCSLTGTISRVTPGNTETILTNGTAPNGE